MNHKRSFSNRIGHILRQSAAEILGATELNSALQLDNQTYQTEDGASPEDEHRYRFHELSGLLEAIEIRYGHQAGQGIALRIGRTAFKIGLRSYGAELGLLEPEFRLLPISQKISAGAAILADTLNNSSDQEVKLWEAPEHLMFEVSHCPVCWGRETDEPTCNFTIGFFQEALYWLSNGKYYDVQEISCSARGDPVCSFTLPKQPCK